MTILHSLIRLLIALAGVLSPGAIGAADTDGSDAPPKRAHHQLVYDADQQRVLLVGGSTPKPGGGRFVFFDDVWAFDGTAWTLVGNSGRPRSGQAVAYDTKRERVLAFGGFCTCDQENGGRYADLLALSGSAWTQVATIPARPTADGLMVYDEARDRLVLFGGGAANRQQHDDTWEFDGTAWTRAAATGPSSGVMAYDAARGRTVFFGASGGSQGMESGETWTYDGTWSRIATDGPPARVAAGMTYDSTRGLVILFGGFGSAGALADTWAWNGKTWTKLADDGPPGRGLPALAYDAARDRVVLFGGRAGYPNDLNDTWEWDGARWAEVAD